MKLSNYLYNVDITNSIFYREQVMYGELKDISIVGVDKSNVTYCKNSVGIESLNLKGDYFLWGYHRLSGGEILLYRIIEVKDDMLTEIAGNRKYVPVILSTNCRKIATTLKLIT